MMRPSGNLGVFDYEALAGAWQLAVHDGAGGDSGTLVEWCLNPHLLWA
ncbi:MAG: proprotein convertase P-domain-containing protein [Chloroflexi bacterium]|nr:proprotein convertase P-domain-containing protein [Chloroflexota bacterium]